MTRKTPAKRKPAELAPAPARNKSTAKAGLRALKRIKQRLDDGEQRIMLTIESTGPKSSVRAGVDGMDDSELTMRLIDAFGTTSAEFVDEMSSLLLTVFNSKNDRRATYEMNAALAVLDGLKPENEVEAMLVTQMIAANHSAMKCLAQVGATMMHAETYGNLAVKLMRTFTAQAEALAKLRRRGEQVVRVVHVHPGGQAVVGDVHHHPDGGRGQNQNTEGQSDATQDPIKRTALPSQDPIGAPVPVSRGRRKAKVPDARRD